MNVDKDTIYTFDSPGRLYALDEQGNRHFFRVMFSFSGEDIGLEPEGSGGTKGKRYYVLYAEEDGWHERTVFIACTSVDEVHVRTAAEDEVMIFLEGLRRENNRMKNAFPGMKFPQDYLLVRDMLDEECC